MDADKRQQNDILPRWMKLKDAARYSSIGEKRLKQLAIDQKIDGYQDPDDKRNGWIFDRLSIDQYRRRPLMETENKILDLMRGI